MGAKAAVITLGGNGALLDDGRPAIHPPAFRAARVVDTAGAGDAFSVALAGRPIA